MTPWLPVYAGEADEWDAIDSAEEIDEPALPSDARRRQLNALSQKRRRDKWRKDREQERVEKPVISYRRFLQEVQHVAMGGLMPRESVFDFCKPAVWPSAAELCDQFHVTWAEAAAEIGLRIGRTR